MNMVFAVLLDALLGEPRRWHPLVGWGKLAYLIERTLNLAVAPFFSRCLGVLAWLLMVVPLVLLSYFAVNLPLYGHFITVLVLYFSIGLNSLAAHARPIAAALMQGDLASARILLARVVSRDTHNLNATDIARASVETVLENGNDAVFAALFWFAIAGAPGALAYRLANTLDAMWGYKTAQFYYFGWAAARLDDGLNYLPARLTALSYALLGNTKLALTCWRTQASWHDSPNAGVVMSAGAGALNLQLGGAAMYHGVVEQRPQLGIGRNATATDIDRALRLVRRTALLWVSIYLIIEVWRA
ncbi:MAG: cobalamin biosynthesis protein [Sulfuriferula sp.]|nr:cobalamin biosynthesis protein [Sulfuriferula sp.]